MAQTIKLKRSATQGAVPSTSDLALGELAVNTYDGKIYIKKDTGTESIVEVGGGTDGNDYVDSLSFSTSTGVLTAGRTGSLSDLTVDLDGRYITGNQTITLSGDVSGSGTTSINVTVADDSHNHIISNVDGLQSALDAKLASSSYTASDVLTKIKTVDGSGSGLDADTVDGIQGSSFLRSDANDSTTGTISYTPNGGLFLRTGGNGSSDTILWRCNANSVAGDSSNHGFTVKYMGSRTGNDNSFSIFSDNQTSATQIEAFQIKQNGDLYNAANKIWTAGNDGSGSGLDADTVDGQHESTFMRKSANSQLDMNNNDIVGVDQIVHEGDTDTYMQFHADNQWRVVAGGTERLEVNGGNVTVNANLLVSDQIRIGDDAWIEDFNVANAVRIKGNQSSSQGYIAFGNRSELLGQNNNGTLLFNNNVVWHAGNDGQYSGLDADRLDGQEGGYYWNLGNDGSGSGLDADTVDGIQASSFLRSNASDTATGFLTFNGGISVLSGTGGGKLRIRRNSGSTDGDDITDIHMDDGGIFIDIDNDNDGDSGNFKVRYKTGGSFSNILFASPTTFTYKNQGIWHAGNDGSGSGLDADTLDGSHESAFVTTSTGLSSNLDTVYRAGMKGWTTSTTGKPSDGYGQMLSIVSSGSSHNNSNNWITQLGFGTSQNTAYFRSKTNSGSWGGWKTFWHSGNDGSGSGLDADTVDGQHESTFMRRSANSQLDMNNNDIIGVDQIIHEGDSNTYIQFHAADQWRVVTGGTERFEVNNNNVTVNKQLLLTAGTDAKLLASGQYGHTFMTFRNNTDTSSYGLIYHSGSSMVYGTSSDYRLKENVVPLEGASEKLKLIPVKSFNFIEDPSRTVDGFLAHELQEHIPEAVVGEKDGIDEDGNPEYQAVDQSKLTPLLTAALQEALAKIEELEQRIENLENN